MLSSFFVSCCVSRYSGFIAEKTKDLESILSESLLMAYVVFSVLVLFGLIFMSFKLLKMSQKERLAEKNAQDNQHDYQLHPKLKQQMAEQNNTAKAAKNSAQRAKQPTKPTKK